VTQKEKLLILVLGGNGFIGRHFRDIARAKTPLTIVRRDPDAAFVTLSESETALSAEAFAGEQGDDAIRRATAVIYLSTASVPGTFEANPWREIPANVEPAVQFFDRCAALNPQARIIMTSSGGTIYGSHHTAPISEDAAACPISAYAMGKQMVEEGLAYLGRSRSLRYTILRLSNPVGRHHNNPRQGLVPVALRAVRSGVPLQLFGDENIRDYVDADEVAEALLLAALDDRKESLLLNIGSGVGHSVADVISLVGDVAGAHVPCVLKPRRPQDVPYVVLDCARAQEALGWRARLSLRDSIASVAAALLSGAA
jgi:UDP-glucose 4-epimerase